MREYDAHRPGPVEAGPVPGPIVGPAMRLVLALPRPPAMLPPPPRTLTAMQRSPAEP